MSGSTQVLVVDDEPALRSALSMLLETTGASVATASSGEEALAAFEAGSFRLVLLDITLPGMSGLEAAARIWSRPAQGERPTILFLSGDAGSREDAARVAEEKGATHEYLLKPVAPDVLLGHVMRHLARA